MLTRAVRRPVAMAAAVLAALLVVPMAPVLTPPAHADSLDWARRLGRDFRAAQQVTRGKNVTVAIVADGVDGRIGTLRGKVQGSRDFVKTPRPKKIEGTLAGSLIGGGGPTYDSPLGMRGLAPAMKILSVRVMPSFEEPAAKRWFDYGGGRDQLARGIRYAVDQGAQVICILPHVWGGDVGGIESALAYARSKGAVVVGRNPVMPESADTGAYPAAFTGVIGVGSLNGKGERLRKYSGKDSAVLVSAPGFEMPSIGPGDSVWTFTGGTPASSFVAATAALVRSEYPKLPPQLVVRAIAESARHPKGGYDTNVGFGIINPAGALDRARSFEGRSVFAPAAQGAISEKSHFGGGPVTVEAVRHDTGLLAGYSGLAGAGLLAIVAAMVLAVRGHRRRTAVAAATGAFTAVPEGATPPPAVPPDDVAKHQILDDR
jgi:hypothetical protein